MHSIFLLPLSDNEKPLFLFLAAMKINGTAEFNDDENNPTLSGVLRLKRTFSSCPLAGLKLCGPTAFVVGDDRVWGDLDSACDDAGWRPDKRHAVIKVCVEFD